MIAILLATYNSERYLSEQIESIMKQSYQDWTLFFRDDGSTDKTIDIIKKYQANNPDKVKLLVDNKGGLKSYGNFVEMLKSVNAEYYLFSDHDDVWLPNKIEISMQRMKEIENGHPNTPVVVHTDMKVVDQDLNVISESFWDFSRFLPERSRFWELVSCNCVNGCTMLFNDKAKATSLGHEPYCLMHDTLVSQSVAAAGGVISAIKQPTVLYRQHFDNVIGAADAKRSYFVHRMESGVGAFKDNYEVWKRARHIKDDSFILFLLVKMKITILRFLK